MLLLYTFICKLVLLPVFHSKTENCSADTMLALFFVAVALSFYIIPNDSVWSDYNAIDEVAEFIDSNDIYIYEGRNHTRLINQFKDSKNQKIARFDDGWSVIKKPTSYPTPSPTKRPNPKKRQQKPTSPGCDDIDQILEEFQKKTNAQPKHTPQHTVKLFSLYSNYSEDAMIDLEEYLIRDKRHNLMLIGRKLPRYPSLDKKQAYTTYVDCLFTYVFQFFEFLDDDAHADSIKQHIHDYISSTVAGLRSLESNTTFYSIYDSLLMEYSNHSNTLDFAVYLKSLYEGEVDYLHFAAHTDYIFENMTMNFILDFFIKVFDQLFELKMHELDLICNPNLYPMTTIKHAITECMHQNKNISAKVVSVIHEFETLNDFCRQNHFSVSQIQQFMGLYIRRQYELITSFVWIKEDLQVVNIINRWTKSHKTSTIYVVSDLIHRRLLESLLAHFDDVKFEKYYAVPNGTHKKKRFRMIPAPKLNTSKANLAKGPKMQHTIKIFPLSRYSEPAMLELEKHLIRNRANQWNFDKILVDDILPEHPSSHKISTYNTKIDLKFIEIYQFFVAILDSNVSFNKLNELLAITVLNLKELSLQGAFHGIYASLIKEYGNDSNAITLCEDIRNLYEDTWSINTTNEVVVEHGVISLIIDFFLKVFNRVMVMKMNELDDLCNPNRFPLAMDQMVIEQRRQNMDLHQQIEAILEKFQQTSDHYKQINYTFCQIQRQFEPMVNVLHDFVAEVVEIKADFEILNIINQYIQRDESSTIYIVSDLIDHEILETALLYFDDYDIQFEKYIAQTLKKKHWKKKYLMMPAPKLSVRKYF